MGEEGTQEESERGPAGGKRRQAQVGCTNPHVSYGWSNELEICAWKELFRGVHRRQGAHQPYIGGRLGKEHAHAQPRISTHAGRFSVGFRA
eukprot:scaffold139_cov325-Pavlova_lutheri.AAC.30